MKNIRFMTNAILLITISILLAASAAPAQTGEILVAGNPSFTETDFADIVKFYERGLDIRFSDDERSELQSKITATWSKYQKSGGRKLSEFMETVRLMNTRVSDEKIKANRQEFVNSLLGDLKAMARNGWSNIVVAVYEKSHGGGDSTQSETPAEVEKNETRKSDESNFQPVAGTVRMSDLVGKWNKGTVSSYGYRDALTNDYKSGYGSSNMHEIRANGSFDYSNFAQISLYGCTTELFTSMKGRASVSGSQITFSYISGSVKGKDSCKSEGFNKPAQIKDATYRLESDGTRLRMCEVGAALANCLYREN